LDFFAEAQRNPSAALTAGADSVADLDRFAMCLETQASKPVPVYTLVLDAGHVGSMQAPASVAAACHEWRQVCPVGKPFSTAPMPPPEVVPWAPEDSAVWLASLQKTPSILDSIDALDDLCAIADMHALMEGPRIAQRCRLPLLERGVAILDSALENAPS